MFCVICNGDTELKSLHCAHITGVHCETTFYQPCAHDYCIPELDINAHKPIIETCICCTPDKNKMEIDCYHIMQYLIDNYLTDNDILHAFKDIDSLNFSNESSKEMNEFKKHTIYYVRNVLDIFLERPSRNNKISLYFQIHDYIKDYLRTKSQLSHEELIELVKEELYIKRSVNIKPPRK
jgi:hypothetical protein